jgi:hypothetical protein
MMRARMTDGVGFQPSLQDGFVFALFPALKAPGYCQSPLRGGKDPTLIRARGDAKDRDCMQNN